MPFDPSIPADNTKAKASEMRAQFIALKAQIDALSTHVDDIVNSYNTTLNDIVHKEADDFASTSPNTNAVNTLDTPFSDPDLETLRAKLNELILNGRR